MKVIYEFEIPTELSEAVEARQIEVAGLERLYKSAMADTQYNIPAEKIDALKKEFLTVNAEYEMLKTKVNDMIPMEYNRTDTSWNLDFASCKVTVSEN